MLKRYLPRIFGDLRIILFIILVGYIIRLLFMPSSVALDLWWASRREYLWAFKDIFLMNDITETILGLYIQLIKPLLPHLGQIFDLTNSQGTINIPEHEIYTTFSRAMRYVFLFKVPYLILDTVLLYFVFRFFQDRKKRITMLLIWALSPALIYAAYVVGRYELFPILPTFIALYFAKQKKSFWSLFFLGVAVTTRMSFLILVPFFVIYFSNSWKEVIKNTLICALPVIIVTKGIEFLYGHNIFADTLEDGFIELAVVKPSLGAGFNAFSPILLLYPLLVFLFYKEKVAMNLYKLSSFCMIAFLIFYATSYLGPQYFAWFTPFLFVSLTLNKKIFWPLVGLVVFFFILQDVFSNTITTTMWFYLLDKDFFISLGGLRNQEFFFNFKQTTLVIILHSIFVFFAFLTSYILYKDRNEVKTN